MMICIVTCVTGDHSLTGQCHQVIVLYLHSSQVLQTLECFRSNLGNLVVVEIDILETMEQGGVGELTDLVEAGIECLQTEATTESVIVSNPVNLVVVNVQPLQ